MSTSTPKNFNLVRAAFMQRVSAPGITPFALKLAYLLAYKYMNLKTQTTFVAQETLAADLNVSVRTVQRLLDLLRPLGLAIVPGHGPNRASTYWIDPEKATPVSPIAPRKGDRKRRQPATEKATPVSSLLKRGTNIEDGGVLRTPPSSGRESARFAR